MVYTDFKPICNTYLQTDDVGTIMLNFFHDALLTVFPIECPSRAVPVELTCAIFITENIVAHDCEYS